MEPNQFGVPHPSASAVVEPLKAVPLDIQSDIADAFVHLVGLDTVFYYCGLIMIILGSMAWLSHRPHHHRKQWGKRFAILGIGFTIVGLNIGAVFSLIYYVLNQ